MNPQAQLQRAHELAQASHNAAQLFWIIVIGGALIIAFWSLVRWKMHQAKAKQRRANLAQSVRVAEKRSKLSRDERRWNGIMDEIGWNGSRHTVAK